MTPVRHPHDAEIWLGDVAALQGIPPGVDAVVSLCHVNDEYLPVGIEQIDIRFDRPRRPGRQSQPGFLPHRYCGLIEQLRDEGRTVLLHCVACQSRTPTVAALYGAREHSIRRTSPIVFLAVRRQLAVVPQSLRHAAVGSLRVKRPDCP